MANRSFPKVLSYTTAIPFDEPVTSLGEHTIVGPVTFTVDADNPQVTYGSFLRLVADGTNTPDFSAFVVVGSGAWVNTAGTLNRVIFFYDGVDYCVSFLGGAAGSGGGGGDTTAPTLVSGEATDATHVDLVINESVTLTAAGWGVYDATDDVTFPVASVSGSGTNWTVVITGTMTAGHDLGMIYTASSGNSKDLANNEFSDISNFGITNSIGGGSTNADATAYLAHQTGLGETIPSGEVQFYHDFFNAIAPFKTKLTGRMEMTKWAVRNANWVDIYLRGDGTEASNTLTVSNTGVTGDASDSVDSGTIPSTDLLQDDCSLFWFCLSTSKASGLQRPMGCHDASTKFTQIIHGDGGVAYMNVNSNQTSNVTGLTIGKKLIGVSRTGASTMKVYDDGVLHATLTEASTGLPTTHMTFFGSKSPTGVNDPITMKAGLFGTGAALTDAEWATFAAACTQLFITDLGL